MSSANNTRQESQLLNVVSDMEEAATNRRAMEARLFEEAELADARGEKRPRKRSPSLLLPPSKSCSTSRHWRRAETTVNAWLMKSRNAYTGMTADVKESGIEADESGKQELQIKAQDFERLISELKREVMEKIETLGSLQIFFVLQS